MRIGIIIGDMTMGGGGERVAATLSNFFSSKGHIVYLYHYARGNKFDIDKDVNLISILNSESKWIKRKFERILGTRNELKKTNLDVLITLGWANSIYGAMFCDNNTKLIASERSDPFSEPKIKAFRLLRNWAYNKSDVLVCQTNIAKKCFPKANGVVIMNPLRTDLPEPYLGKRRNAVVTYCRIAQQKNIPLLLKAFKFFHNLHKEFTLEIYGNGPLEGEMHRLASFLGVDRYVTFKPFMRDVHNIIKDAYMYVSSSDYEGLSNSMLEAMAIGMPVISTDCPIGGARMVIRSGINGMLVPVGDVKKMTSAMCRMADDTEFAYLCGKNAQEIKTMLSVENICNKWLQLM